MLPSAAAVSDHARRLAGRVPGLSAPDVRTQARRSLPIGRPPDAVERLWTDPAGRERVLDGLPVADASLETGPAAGARRTTATVNVRLEPALPRMAAQALAGTVVRRLKALAETGEIPTAARNPSARRPGPEAAR